MPHELGKSYIWRLPFSMLPQTREWKNGQHYKVELKVRQTDSDETGASFEIVQATDITENIGLRSSSHKKSISTDTGHLRY